MGRTSFTQELKGLAKARRADGGRRLRREVIFLHRELGRSENALGRAAWMMRYGRRGEWRGVLRDAAAEAFREARRAASVYDGVRLREAAACPLRASKMGNDSLRNVLQATGLQADELADAVRVDVRTVRRWLAGGTPHPRQRAKIARALDRSEGALWPELVATAPPGTNAALRRARVR